jgi:hypothetical protein
VGVIYIVDFKRAIVPGCDFTWKEYAHLKEWDRLIQPDTREQFLNAQTLFGHIQKYIREPLDMPLTIDSGARTKAYVQYLRAKKIPAALNGAHNSWEGVDLYPPRGWTNQKFWHWCNERWPGRMELLKYTPGWCHLDIRNWGSKQRFVP